MSKAGSRELPTSDEHGRGPNARERG